MQNYYFKFAELELSQHNNEAYGQLLPKEMNKPVSSGD